MAGLRHHLCRILLALMATALAPGFATAQASLEELAGIPVVNVRVVPHGLIPQDAVPPLATRPGMLFDPRALEADVARLINSQRFVDARPYVVLPESGGLEVVIDVVDLRIRPPTVRMQSPDPWDSVPAVQDPAADLHAR
jgi:hypothetical protein